MADEILVLRDVSSGYGAVAVVRSVNLALRAGEALALLGKNRMGKTTLLKTIVAFCPCKAARSGSPAPTGRCRLPTSSQGASAIRRKINRCFKTSAYATT